MSNQECLKSFSEKLSIFEKLQEKAIDENIETIKQLNASKGLLRSGATIKQVMRACTKLLGERSRFIIASIKALPLEFEKNVYKKLMKIIEPYFPEDLGALDERLRNIVLLTGNEEMAEEVFNKVKKNRKTIFNQLENEVKEHLLTIKKTARLVTIDKTILGIEGVSLLAIAFLAGKWSINPLGEYQRYIIVFGIIFLLIEIGRRLWKKYVCKPFL